MKYEQYVAPSCGLASEDEETSSVTRKTSTGTRPAPGPEHCVEQLLTSKLPNNIVYIMDLNIWKIHSALPLDP